jgi:peptide/nickel transport system substrate-binding protein
MTKNYWTAGASARINRRRLLRGAALAGVGLAGAALVGCGRDDGVVATPSPGTQPGAAPVASPEGVPPRHVSARDFQQMTLEEMRQSLDPAGLRYLPGQLQAMDHGPVTGGTLRYSRNAPTSFDFLSVRAIDMATNPGTHSSLLTFHMNGDFGPHGDFIVEPDLPESFEYTDTQTLVFRLRDQPVYWHDIAPVNGRELTVEDVKYGIEALKAAPIQGVVYRDIERIETPDAKTLVLHFARPAAYFLRASCTPYQFLAPREQVEAGTLNEGLIGSGAFQLEQAEPDVRLHYTRNPRYFKTDPMYGTNQRLPFLDRIEGTHLVDLATNNAAWAAGDIDYAYTVNVSRLDIVERLRDRPEAVTVIVPPPPSYQPYIAINSNTPPLNDARVRRALSMAIDRDGIGEGIAGGLATFGYSQDWTYFDRPENPWPWTNDELGSYMQYNPDEAKKLLQAAGFDKGIGRTMEIAWGTGMSGNNNAVWLAMSDMMQRALGVEVDLAMAADGATYNRKLRQGQYQDLNVATPLPAWDPDDFAYGQMNSKSTANYHNINDPEIDRLTERQQVELDVDERRKILLDIMQRDLDQMYRLWGINFYKFTVRSPKLYNFADHYLAWMTPGWGERKLELAWKAS